MPRSAQLVVDSASGRSVGGIRERRQQPALVLFAIGMAGLGALALRYGDFALGWQPVAPWFPARTTLAYGSGVLMVLCGLGLSFRKLTVWAMRILFPYLIVWQLLKLPAILVAPKIEGVYVGFGELAVLLAGGWTLFALLGDQPTAKWLSWASGENGLRAARYYFALWIIPIGLSHWLYLQPSVDLVPPWLPDRAFWAHLAGAGQIASGFGILFGVLPRVAAWAEAVQIWLYTVLIWLPAILTSNRNLGPSFAHADRRLSLTAFWISWIIASGATAVAQNIRTKPAARNKRRRTGAQ